jgi:hypothetical protein
LKNPKFALESTMVLTRIERPPESLSGGLFCAVLSGTVPLFLANCDLEVGFNVA